MTVGSRRSKCIFPSAAVILFVLVFGLLILLRSSGGASASGGNFAGGDGSAYNPYQIEDVQDLQNMKLDMGAHYVLVKDIDASETKNWNDGKSFEPVGRGPNKFYGSLDGHGYKIRELFINRNSEDSVGLFGSVGSGGSVLNVNMVNVHICGNKWVGGLAGDSYKGNIENCSVTGNVRGGDNYIGGLVGQNDGTVKNCYATGNVTGVESVGGLVGQNHGTVLDCYAANNVSGNVRKVGGLVGYNDGTVKNSYATGNVSGNDYVGGLTGHNSKAYGGNYDKGKVENCYATGNVSGDWQVGGLIGYNYVSIIKNSYATGSVTGNVYIGGLVGRNHESKVTNSYSTGHVTGGDDVGGLVGHNYDTTVEHCFWDVETSGTTKSDQGTGKNTTNMMKKSTFTHAGWNFEDIWNIIDGKSYPYLRTFTSPPRITTEDVTEVLEDNNYSVHYNALVFPIPGYGYPQILWSLNTNAAWLSMTPDGILTGTPINKDVGNYWVNVSILDESGDLDYTNFTLTVENTNDPPVIQTTALPNGTVGQTYGYNLTAIDVDGDALTWSMETNASWLSLNSTGTLEGTPPGAGSYWVNASVADGNGGTDSVNLTITILPDLDGDGIPDTEDTDMDGDGVPNTSDAFPNDPTKWKKEENKSSDNESFLYRQIGPLQLYAYLVIVIVGLVAGVGALKMKGKKSDGKGNVQKTEQSQGFQQQQFQQQFQQFTQPLQQQPQHSQEQQLPAPPSAQASGFPVQAASPQQQFQQFPQQSPPQQQFPQPVPSQQPVQPQQFIHPAQSPRQPQPQYQQPQNPLPTLQQSPAVQASNWTCPNCGKTVDAKFIFCTSCGYKRGG